MSSPLHPPIDLKLILMTLGNRLVLECGFDPALAPSDRPNTCPIKCFTDWANKYPAVREVLDDMGFAWPVVEQRTHLANADAVCSSLLQKAVAATTINGRFPSGREGVGIFLAYRHGWLMFYLDQQSHAWCYEDYDSEKDCRGSSETWLKGSALPVSVADLILGVFKEKGGHRN